MAGRVAMFAKVLMPINPEHTTRLRGCKLTTAAQVLINTSGMPGDCSIIDFTMVVSAPQHATHPWRLARSHATVIGSQPEAWLSEWLS